MCFGNTEDYRDNLKLVQVTESHGPPPEWLRLEYGVTGSIIYIWQVSPERESRDENNCTKAFCVDHLLSLLPLSILDIPNVSEYTRKVFKVSYSGYYIRKRRQKRNVGSNVSREFTLLHRWMQSCKCYGNLVRLRTRPLRMSSESIVTGKRHSIGYMREFARKKRIPYAIVVMKSVRRL